MKRITDLIGRLKNLEAGFIQTIQRVLEENETIILEMNSEDQLFEKGMRRDGVHIDSYAPYAPYTIQIKREKGQPFDRVTLRDEGDFESSFFLNITNTGFEIKASDWKTEELTFSYGAEILGLTDENLTELLREYILPELLKLVRKL